MQPLEFQQFVSSVSLPELVTPRPVISTLPVPFLTRPAAVFGLCTIPARIQLASDPANSAFLRSQSLHCRFDVFAAVLSDKLNVVGDATCFLEELDCNQMLLLLQGVQSAVIVRQRNVRLEKPRVTPLDIRELALSAFQTRNKLFCGPGQIQQRSLTLRRGQIPVSIDSSAHKIQLSDEVEIVVVSL